MAISLDEYIARLETASRELKAQEPNLIFEYGQSIVDQIAERIQDNGNSPSGSPLKEYSASYLKFKQNPQDYKRGKDLGLASSRYTGKVDYSLTGEMWRNIGLIAENYGDPSRLVWGGRSELTRGKITNLTKRDGAVLQPSEGEENIALDELRRSIDRILAPIK